MECANLEQMTRFDKSNLPDLDVVVLAAGGKEEGRMKKYEGCQRAEFSHPPICVLDHLLAATGEAPGAIHDFILNQIALGVPGDNGFAV